jgi:hypothetical protein
MIWAIDTNVLLDILIPNAAYAERSLKCLTGLNPGDELIISPVVFAELASQFPSADELEKFLGDTGIELVSLSRSALLEASRAWKAYAQVRTEAVLCARCGHKQKVTCAVCKEVIACRQHILSDFLIGAHAKVHADKLITRDRGFYRTYFRDLKLLIP